MGFPTLNSNVSSRFRDAWRDRRQRLRFKRPIDSVIDRLIAETTADARDTQRESLRPVTVPDYLKASWANGETGDMPVDDTQPSFEFLDAVDLPAQAESTSQTDRVNLRDREINAAPTTVEDLAALSFDDLLAQFMRSGHHEMQTEANMSITFLGKTESALPTAERALLDQTLEELTDAAVEKLHAVLVRTAHGWHSQHAARVRQTVKQPRRKHIDARHTIRRRLGRSAGVFSGFSYRDSPSTVWQTTKPLQLLVICDVSGSMGHYVAVVLYVLTCLAQLGEVESYVFSDTPTYASPLLQESDFRAQFQRLKTGSSSWEYGTRLSLALREVLSDGRFTEDTAVLLFTDGGFSLTGTDWEDTVSGLAELHRCVRHLYVVTPNLNLVVDGPVCAEELWDVERAARRGDELLTGRLQKIARFGLLARYSHDILLCQTAADLVSLLDKISF